MTENHTAIVLRSADYRDNDKMLTLLTAKKGRISALARGIRKQGSAMFGTADVFCCSDFGFYIKNGRYILTQGVLKNSFFNIRADLNSLLTASAINEICELASTEEEENARLFALLAGSLFALDRNIPADKVFCFFAVKLLDILGMRPETDKCVICGKERTNKVNIYHGGAVCEVCSGEVVPSELFNDIRKVIKTPSKSIITSELFAGKRETELLARWISEALYKKPKSLRLMLDSVNHDN